MSIRNFANSNLIFAGKVIGLTCKYWTRVERLIEFYKVAFYVTAKEIYRIDSVSLSPHNSTGLSELKKV
jgi:hypothetical protein